jgi:hypothetical protein
MVATPAALVAINEAEPLAERQQRDYRAELHRLRGVFLAAIGADETQIEASYIPARAKTARPISQPWGILASELITTAFFRLLPMRRKSQRWYRATTNN